MCIWSSEVCERVRWMCRRTFPYLHFLSFFMARTHTNIQTFLDEIFHKLPPSRRDITCVMVCVVYTYTGCTERSWDLVSSGLERNMSNHIYTRTEQNTEIWTLCIEYSIWYVYASYRTNTTRPRALYTKVLFFCFGGDGADDGYFVQVG